MVSWNSTLHPERKGRVRSSGRKSQATAADVHAPDDAQTASDSESEQSASGLSNRDGNHSGLVPVSDTGSAVNAAYLQALLKNNPLGIVMTDLGGRIHACNPAFEALFGYELQEIRGMNVDSLLVPPEQIEEAQYLTQRAARGDVIRAICRRRCRGGAMIDVQMIGVPLEAGGKRFGSFAMFEDISERVRAEEARTQAEERFRGIFENAVEGIFLTTVDGRYLRVNPALARMCGYASPEEMIAAVANVADMYAVPGQRKEFKQLIAERGAIEGLEYQLVRKDGKRVWVSENAHVVRDATGIIVGYEGTVQDISERKRSELERQATTEVIHSVNVTDNLDDLLRMIHNALRKVLYAENCFVALYEPATKMFHFPFLVDQHDPLPPPPQKAGRSCTAFVYRTGRAMLIPQRVFDELAERGEVELVGTPSPSWLGVPLRTPAATIGVLVVQHYGDETAYTERDLEFLSSVGGQIALAIERKRAETKLRESEARLRVLVEQLPAVLWTVDRDLRFTSCVGAGLARLDLKPNEIVGKLLSDYFKTADETFLPLAAHRRAVAGEPVTFHIDWKGGSYACHVEPFHDGKGQVLGAICTSLDVTERKELEEQLRHSQKMEAVGRLAGGIAHDFNNLLMVIQGYADLLAERLPAGDSLHRNAEQIQTAAQRAGSLTRQLLAFSRKQMLAPSVISIQSVVNDMEKILRRLIGEDVQLQTHSASDLWLVKADRSQIEQVIMNLAVNARDAMPSGGQLTIETANVELDATLSQHAVAMTPGEYVMLAVTDNGCGMDAQTQAHLFEPFFTTKEKGKGTGLGLATVYGIVKQSGGYIWVYSEAGRGTTFKVYLPRIEQEVAKPRNIEDTAGAAMKSGRRGSETVLLVEDEEGVRQLTREYLETYGYTVIQAADGHAALELTRVHQGPIHLLVTDVVMPGINGRELAERAVKIRPAMKVLYMSGYTDQAVVQHGMVESGSVLLQKPFTMGALAAKLRELLSVEEALQ